VLVYIIVGGWEYRPSEGGALEFVVLLVVMTMVIVMCVVVAAM
jgi:hypothetical protein